MPPWPKAGVAFSKAPGCLAPFGPMRPDVPLRFNSHGNGNSSLICIRSKPRQILAPAALRRKKQQIGSFGSGLGEALQHLPEVIGHRCRRQGDFRHCGGKGLKRALRDLTVIEPATDIPQLLEGGMAAPPKGRPPRPQSSLGEDDNTSPLTSRPLRPVNHAMTTGFQIEYDEHLDKSYSQSDTFAPENHDKTTSGHIKGKATGQEPRKPAL